VFSISGWLRRRATQRNLRQATPIVQQIRERQAGLAHLADFKLAQRSPQPGQLVEAFALVAEAAKRVLGIQPFDVQLMAGIAMHHGHIAEMQTGEGKTLAAVFPVYLNALSGEGVHVMTVNDYLARRDAEWMGDIYKLLGLTVGYVVQGMSVVDRRTSYYADVTYGTANEIGFDLLRDHLAHDPAYLVQRDFNYALIDEADSILIDEARIPLVIAGGLRGEASASAMRMAQLARALVTGVDYTKDEYARNVNLTPHGAARAEAWLRCSNLYDLENLPLLTALNHAIHAKELLRRDVDYVVKNGSVELVDEFKGRIASDRRWPDGLQAALEAKEGVRLRREGRVLGSLTLQNLIALYPKVAGMTATAATQAEEFKRVYGLEVVVIPPNRPNIRKDYADVIFTHRAAKEAAIVGEIKAVHATGRPILAGTASVEESERLSYALHIAGVPHEVLNARNDEQEARIIARAGELGAVTISTNMAGRGTDIRLGGPQVVELGGLYVIGTNKHESRRIDNQLRGRAGRQGDPGSSMFIISLEDTLIQRFGIMDLLPWRYRHFRSDEPIEDPLVDTEVNRAQRIIESQNVEIRQRLWRYEGILEKQRQIIHDRRRAVLLREEEGSLAKIDQLWSDYLVRIAELREGIHWVAVAGHDPVHEFRKAAIEMFDQLLAELENEDSEFRDEDIQIDTSSTWTYIINDQPMGDFAQRFFKGVVPLLRSLQRGSSKGA
jgi:preprotein translocase subunit SecA